MAQDAGIGKLTAMTVLAEFLAAMAEHVAHSRGWTRDEAARWLAIRVAEAQVEYRQAGSPLGDSDEGFVAWLQPRHQPPTA